MRIKKGVILYWRAMLGKNNHNNYFGEDYKNEKGRI